MSFPKPKRKYTSSEKSRAASRKNLEKANQATERRLIACYQALEKAVAELRRFDSPHYGLGFKRGTSCASLPRSLVLAGDTREEYEAHLERMRKAFAPLTDRERKLVLAAAGVWRTGAVGAVRGSQSAGGNDRGAGGGGGAAGGGRARRRKGRAA